MDDHGKLGGKGLLVVTRVIDSEKKAKIFHYDRAQKRNCSLATKSFLVLGRTSEAWEWGATRLKNSSRKGSWILLRGGNRSRSCLHVKVEKAEPGEIEWGEEKT